MFLIYFVLALIFAILFYVGLSRFAQKPDSRSKEPSNEALAFIFGIGWFATVPITLMGLTFVAIYRGWLKITKTINKQMDRITSND